MQLYLTQENHMTTSTISPFENISYGKQLALFIIAWREMNDSVAMIEQAERVFAGENIESSSIALFEQEALRIRNEVIERELMEKVIEIAEAKLLTRCV
jgi:hypothetical protein